MYAKLLSFALLLVLLTNKKAANGASTPVVEVDPTPLNVSVNAQANFSCVVRDAELVLWYANDSNIDTIKGFVDTHSLEKTNDSSNATYVYKIFFIVHESLETVLDDSDIKCIGVAFQPYYVFSESSEVKLRVEGVLDPPREISANLISDVLNITWMAPYLLDNIIIYDYYINVTAYNSSGIIIYQTNTTVFENFTFALVDQSACTVYSSSVQARSDAGLGHAGMANMVNTFEVPKRLNASQIGVQVIFTEDDTILQFTIEQDNCTGQQAESISVTIFNNTDVISTNTTPAEANADGNINITATVPSSVLGVQVNTIITLINKIGSSESEEKLISIASIESVIFTEKGSVVNFQCLFANLSHPKGCYVVLDCICNQFDDITWSYSFNLSIQENLYTSEIGNVTCMLRNCSTYNIHTYDIADDGSKGVLAWSENNKTLCPLSKGACSPYTSPMTSSIPDPKRIPDWLPEVLYGIGGFILLLILIVLMIAVIFIGKRCKKKKEKDMDQPQEKNKGQPQEENKGQPQEENKGAADTGTTL